MKWKWSCQSTNVNSINECTPLSLNKSYDLPQTKFLPLNDALEIIKQASPGKRCVAHDPHSIGFPITLIKTQMLNNQYLCLEFKPFHLF